MAAAERDVAVVPADLRLLAMAYGTAFGVDTQVHRRLSAAGADRLEFDQHVGEGQQAFAAFEQLRAKVGAQAIGEHGYT